MSNTPRFVMLKSLNGEPMLVNLWSVLTISTINMAGTDVGVVAFDKEHEVVVGSTPDEVLAAIEAAKAGSAS